MMQKDEEKQGRFMFVNLDDYIPQDHLLRAIRKSIDFSFIYDKVSHLYKGNRVNKIYSARPENCKNCLRRKECFGVTARYRIISRPLFQEAFEGNKNRANTLEYKRGFENVQEQCLMAALAMNIKRMVKASR